MRNQAHRPRAIDAGRIAKYALIAVLLVLVFVAWTAVPEPDLMGWYR